MITIPRGGTRYLYFNNNNNNNNNERVHFCRFVVAIAVAVPTIGPFIGLIGAFCFSLLGIIMPTIIEFATYWDKVTVWMTIRNAVLISVGILALVFGTSNSVVDIINAYVPVPELAINATGVRTAAQ